MQWKYAIKENKCFIHSSHFSYYMYVHVFPCEKYTKEYDLAIMHSFLRVILLAFITISSGQPPLLPGRIAFDDVCERVQSIPIIFPVNELMDFFNVLPIPSSVMDYLIALIVLMKASA